DREALASALSRAGAARAWLGPLGGELLRRAEAGGGRRLLRRVLRRLDAGAAGAVAERLRDAEAVQQPGMVVWVADALVAAAAPVGAAPGRGAEPLPGPVAKTLAERFPHVSEGLSCPRGCAGTVRYGRRVGDLGKYASIRKGRRHKHKLSELRRCIFVQFFCSSIHGPRRAGLGGSVLLC
ncbi:unnamed protein product, partial [Prorocentrum cordatum]